MKPMTDEQKSSTAHDMVTGGLEGAAGVLATDKLIHKFVPQGSGVWRKLAIGGLVGAGATGLIGAAVSATAKKRREAKAQQGQPMPINVMGAMHQLIELADKRMPIREYVVRDKIIETEAANRDHNYTKAGVTGAVAGLAFPGKLSKLKRAAIGAGAGVAGVGAIRGLTNGMRDEYGERNYEARQAETWPGSIATGAVAGGLLLRGSQKFSRAKKFMGGFRKAK
jgi:hypothetical protein